MSNRFVTRVFLLVGVFLSGVHCGAPAPEPGFPVPSPMEAATATPLPLAQPTHEPIEAPPAIDVSTWGQVVAAPPDSTVVIYTDPGDVPRLEVAGEQRKFPLVRTDVRANVRGGVAEVEVTQKYQNPSDKPIEAVYIFPLPENSAVYRMRMAIGERVIEADVKERQAAKKMYEAAKRAGNAAALLEQERPNVFTQSVANIAPGKEINVKIQYVQDLTYDAGQYEFVFPMVVGPRYNAHADDAARISPPYMGTGERSGADVSVEVNVDPEPVATNIEVPTHEVSKTSNKGALKVALKEKKALPNRDFVMRWRVVGNKPRARLLLSEMSGQEGYFSLLVHPPELPIESLVGKREIIFVVDVSGSMSGLPLDLCRMAMQKALRGLRPVDTFNIVTFAGFTGKVFEKPRSANQESIRDALEYIYAMRAGGGTEMRTAVDEALKPNVEAGRHRYVFFLTDGYIGDEARIFAGAGELVAGLEAKGQRARVFGMGIGSSPNRHLIEGLSHAGKGLATYAGNREDPGRAVNAVYHYIDRAVLTDVKPDWAAIGATEVFPSAAPDLFASHPIVLHGMYKSQPSGPMVVRAKAGNDVIEIPVDVRQGVGGARDTLGRLWARSKIASFDESGTGQGDESQKKVILDLGLQFHLVTKYTSLIAVDTSQTVGDGNPETIQQPVDGPEDVNIEMAGGRHRQLEVLSMPIMAAQRDERRPRSWGGGNDETADVYAVQRVSGGCFCRAGAGTITSSGWAAGVVLVVMYVGRRRAKSFRG